MTADAGCTVNDTLTVTTSPSPLIQLGPDRIICNNQPITVNATGGFTSYVWSNGATTQALTTSITGIYTLTVTNAAGCEAFDQIVFTENATPSAAFTFVANGLQVAFTDGSSGTGNYAWDFQNNGSVDNTTAGDVTYTYSQPGQYVIRLIVSNACGSDTAFANLNATTVGLGNSSITPVLPVSPNPTTGVFYVQLEDIHTRVRLYSVSGALIAEEKLMQTGRVGIQLLVGKLPGVYLLETITEAGSGFQRIMLIQE
jgi:PKD repeat protein